MPTNAEMDEALAQLWKRIPDIENCQGKCWMSCGPVDRSVREDQLIRRRGIKITPSEVAKDNDDPSKVFWCEALDGCGRCRVYDVRPTMCRLWGAWESMPCPYGCAPASGLLSAEEGLNILMDSLRIGGTDRFGEDAIDLSLDRLRTDPLMQAAWQLILERDRSGLRNRARVVGDQLPPEVTRRSSRRQR